MTALEKLKEEIIVEGYDPTPEIIQEILIDCSKIVYKRKIESHRWYDDYFYVVKTESGALYGYTWYYMTGDSSPYDMGLEFDLNSICFVESREITKTIYVPKGE